MVFKTGILSMDIHSYLYSEVYLSLDREDILRCYMGFYGDEQSNTNIYTLSGIVIYNFLFKRCFCY